MINFINKEVDSMEKISLDVLGMKCINCEKAVVETLCELGCEDVSASTVKGRVEFAYNPSNLDMQTIKDAITKGGFMPL